MRISMWILAAWLAKYDPEVRIQQGERILQNARLFSDDLKISRTTVYLNQIQRDLVLCSSGHDFLVLHADDVNAVFNDILDAFDFYRAWHLATADSVLHFARIVKRMTPDRLVGAFYGTQFTSQSQGKQGGVLRLLDSEDVTDLHD